MRHMEWIHNAGRALYGQDVVGGIGVQYTPAPIWQPIALAD